MSNTKIAGRLVRLGESGRTVADPVADVRGRSAVDSRGERIGEVQDLFVDDAEGEVRFLYIRAGGLLGSRKGDFLVPVEAVKAAASNWVRISRDRAALAQVPRYDPVSAQHPAYFSDLYGWWCGPCWAPGYLYRPSSCR